MRFHTSDNVKSTPLSTARATKPSNPHQVKGPKNRRAHERYKVRIDANAYCKGRLHTIVIRCVSCGGLLIGHGPGIRLGDRLIIKTKDGLSYAGRIVWCEGDYSGVAFNAPISEDDAIFRHCNRF